MNGIDPAWITNALFVVVGFIVKRGLSELKEMRADLDGIKLLLAQQYTTKAEAREIARVCVVQQQSEVHDRMAEGFFTRLEGELMERQLSDLAREVHKQ
jgi:hypothetical protein